MNINPINQERYDWYIEHLIKTGANTDIINLPSIQNIIKDTIKKGDKRVILEHRSPIYYKDANEDGTFDICGRTNGPVVTLIYKMEYCKNNDPNEFLLLKKYEHLIDKRIVTESEIIIDKEGKIKRNEKINDYNIGYTFDSLFEILKNLQKSKDYYKKVEIKMEEIKINIDDDLETVVNKLLKAKERGEHIQYRFKGDLKEYLLDSDTVSMDSAFLEIVGCTKEEYDIKLKEFLKKYRKELEINKLKKQQYKEIFENRKDEFSKEITLEKVVNGLKFFAEHQSVNQEELINELLNLGCNFTFSDIKEQFPGEMDMKRGMQEGNLACGASIIANVMKSDVSRTIMTDVFLIDDNESSIYNFIRVTTNDDTYTKEYVNKINRKNTKLK